ncbi:MAG TPA: hypothetical protein VFX01_02415 [Methylophilaceae bacterium]|nr:hypothetical protein [Methylophilaceae bacterium]
MKQPHAQNLPTHQRREYMPGENCGFEPPTDEMVEAGAEFLYGKTRAAAIELEQEERFQACCAQARELFLAMLMAKAAVSQQQLADNPPVNNPPLLW